MLETKTKEQQKVSDNNNYYWGYFIQTIESKANNYIIEEYKGIFDDFINKLKSRLNQERSPSGSGMKIEDFSKAMTLINLINDKFAEFKKYLKPSIVEGFLDEIAKEREKDL